MERRENLRRRQERNRRKKGCFSVYGLNWRAEAGIDLPEYLTLSTADFPDVIIRKGQVSFPGAAERNSNSDPEPGVALYATPQQVFFQWPEIGRFSIRGGNEHEREKKNGNEIQNEIVVQPAPGVDPKVLWHWLAGPAMGAMLSLRGLLVLHANTIAFGDEAVLFLGDPGVGKSTLAAEFWRRGYPLVTDDQAVVSFTPEPPRILPGFTQFRLWPDAAQAVRIDPETLPRLADQTEKRTLDASARRIDRPLPVRQIYVLKRTDASRLDPLHGESAFIELVRHTYGLRRSHAAHRGRHFHQVSALVNRVPVKRLSVPHDLTRLVEVADLIENDLRSDADTLL